MTEVSTSQAAARQKVLDEDEWTECLEAIIQRDYFPIVPKLQNKLEWLEVSRREHSLLPGCQFHLFMSQNGIEQSHVACRLSGVEILSC